MTSVQDGNRVPPGHAGIQTFGNYRCAWTTPSPCPSKHLVIAMESRNPSKDSPLRYEWSGTLARLSLGCSALYVMDRTNSWYTDHNGWDDLCGYIADLQAQAGIEWTVCFGLSMGGYGSAVLSSRGIVDRVVALAAQTCIGPSAPFDWRFQDDWARLANGAVTDAVDLVHTGCEYVLCSPCDDAIDVVHLARFQSAVPRATCLVVQGDHHFKALRTTARLDRLLARLLSDPSIDSIASEPTLPAGIAALATTVASGALEAAFATYLTGASRDDRFVSVHLFQNLRRAGEAFPARRHQDMAVVHADQYLTEGWSWAEPWGRWAVGFEHVIAFRAVDFNNGEPLFLSLDFLTFGAAGTFQRVRFLSSNCLVHDLSLRCEFERGTVLIPILAADAVIKVETPDAVSPRQLDGSDDPRPLSIGLLSMKIVTASDLQ